MLKIQIVDRDGRVVHETEVDAKGLYDDISALAEESSDTQAAAQLMFAVDSLLNPLRNALMNEIVREGQAVV